MYCSHSSVKLCMESMCLESSKVRIEPARVPLQEQCPSQLVREGYNSDGDNADDL